MGLHGIVDSIKAVDAKFDRFRPASTLIEHAANSIVEHFYSALDLLVIKVNNYVCSVEIRVNRRHIYYRLQYQNPIQNAFGKH